MKRRKFHSTSTEDGSDKGLLIVDENCMTTVDGVFAAGDVVLGSKTVVNAVSQAKVAVEGMLRYLEDLEAKKM